jgi:Xaa-Pro aminopeptidase
MEPGSVMLLFGAPHSIRNGDSEYKYRPSSDVLYLAGWEDPEVVVFLPPDAEQPFVLFVQPREPEREVWTGLRAGVEGAVAAFGAAAAYPISELSNRLPEMLLGATTLYHDLGQRESMDELVSKALTAARQMSRKSHQEVPGAIVSLSRLLHEQRLVKSEAEIDLLREAARITGEAHRAAMRATKPGMYEYELEALIDYTFRSMGGTGPGYSSIVGSGANACILHYINNRDQLAEGDLVLVDAGCEYGWYTADVTRTWPVNGTFSTPAREIYELVLATNEAVIESVQQGTPYTALQELAVRFMTQGLVDLSILSGEVESLVEDKAYRRFYMHGIGHWLGLDVHDAGKYDLDGAPRTLEPGMVLTVEPGLYFSPLDLEVPERYRGIGVRIEDDVLVTESGPDVLTREIPKRVEDVEALVAG